jgi:outer membrane lipoprotein carrier protein LolA
MRYGGHVALALALLMSVRSGAADNDLDERTHGHVSYVEQDYLAVLERPLESSGELLYERPDRLEKRTLVPRPASLILEKGNLIIQNGRRKRVLTLRDYPQIAPFIESMRATLAGDRAALEQVFQMNFQGSLARWTITLVPLEKKLKNVVQLVRIEGDRGELHTVNIVHADGDHSLMTIGPSITP